MTDFQSRIAAKHDNIRRKIIDRNLEMLGHVTDCIRVKSKKNREGDILSRVVESADIVSISFPPMKDVPIRELKNENGGYLITSLVSAVAALDNQPPEFYTIQAPRHNKLQVGDLIFRVMMEPDADFPIVLGLELVEKLGTFGTNSLIQNSYKVAIHEEPLPQKMIDVIAEMAKRRLFIKY